MCLREINCIMKSVPLDSVCMYMAAFLHMSITSFGHSIIIPTLNTSELLLPRLGFSDDLSCKSKTGSQVAISLDFNNNVVNDLV